mmetsp:Transcript_74148/g.166418  ORF Transcript_74148/g.166418 Transcript_74148/m.166418 type:complete len:134 (-) Transcript_74148:166-567(-)
MGKRKGGAGSGGGPASSSGGGEHGSAEPPRKRGKASDARISITSLSNEELEARLRDLLAEVKDAMEWQTEVRGDKETGRMRLGELPKDRARTHALYGVQKAKQAFTEVRCELEKRGLRIPQDCRMTLVGTWHW